MITKELTNKPWVIEVSHNWNTYEVDAFLQSNPHEYAKNKVLELTK